MQWFYLYFPNLQLESSLPPSEKHTSLTPCALIKQGIIVQTNPVARSLGIGPGTGLAQAALLCSELSLSDYQERLEQQLLRQLAHELYQLSATLYLDPPQGILLYAKDMQRLYDDTNRYWQHLQVPLQARHLSYHYAAAHRPLAAQILARSGSNQLCKSEQQAMQLLAQLPIEHSGLETKLIQQLQRLGIQLLGQAQQLPSNSLGKRFGQSLVTYLQALQQAQTPKQKAYRPRPHFNQQLPLLYEVENSAGLRFPLLRLLQDLEQFLYGRQWQVASLQVGLNYRYQNKDWFTIGSGAPEYKAKVWLDLIMLRLEQIQLQQPVTGLHIKGRQYSPWQAETRSLFDDRNKGSLTPGQLLGRLQNKLGSHAVQQLQLHDDYRPEHAASSFPVQQISLRSTPTQLATQAPRPSILLPLPQPLNHKPRYGWLYIQGPERIQSGWWDNQAICRDYFIARNPQGQLCWLFRNHREEWFLHGYFA